MKNLIYVSLGFLFATVLIYSEAYHWLRIQAMFKFQSFYMFGMIFSAIGTAALGVYLIKKVKAKTITGEPIKISPKNLEFRSNLLGGLIFGAGWGITGACSAPLFILLGLNYKIALIALSGAFLGAFVYGIVKPKIG